jgi:hypothetical protein
LLKGSISEYICVMRKIVKTKVVYLDADEYLEFRKKAIGAQKGVVDYLPEWIDKGLKTGVPRAQGRLLTLTHEQGIKLAIMAEASGWTEKALLERFISDGMKEELYEEPDRQDIGSILD